jgi:hypothetical protein
MREISGFSPALGAERKQRVQTQIDYFQVINSTHSLDNRYLVKASGESKLFARLWSKCLGHKIKIRRYDILLTQSGQRSAPKRFRTFKRRIRTTCKRAGREIWADGAMVHRGGTADLRLDVTAEDTRRFPLGQLSACVENLALPRQGPFDPRRLHCTLLRWGCEPVHVFRLLGFLSPPAESVSHNAR